MLQNTAILKVGGGLAAVGGTAGAGYYAHSQGAFNFQKETSENVDVKNYLIVKSTTHTSTASGEIYDYGFFSSPKKNFQCLATVTSEIIDEECEIHKLSDEEKKLAKAITNNFGATTNNIKEEGNYFKITSTKLIAAINKWEDNSEQLISITQTDKSKVFGKLMPIYRVKNGEIVKRKTSFLYAKVKDSVGTSVTQPSDEIKTSSDKNYQCQISEDKFNCSISELTIESSKKTIDISGNTSPTKANLKAKDKHFKIEMEEKHLRKIKFTDDQTINVIALTTPNTSENYAKLTPLFHTIDKEISGKDNFLLSVDTTAGGANASKTGYKKCKIDDSTTLIDCEIHKFTSEQESTADITFASMPTKTEDAHDIKQNKHFVIKISNDVLHINNLTSKTSIKLCTGTTADPEYTFTIKKRLFFDSTDNNVTTASSVHLLDI